MDWLVGVSARELGVRISELECELHSLQKWVQDLQVQVDQLSRDPGCDSGRAWRISQKLQSMAATLDRTCLDFRRRSDDLLRQAVVQQGVQQADGEPGSLRRKVRAGAGDLLLRKARLSVQVEALSRQVASLHESVRKPVVVQQEQQRNGSVPDVLDSSLRSMFSVRGPGQDRWQTGD